MASSSKRKCGCEYLIGRKWYIIERALEMEVSLKEGTSGRVCIKALRQYALL
jgi:hypothetical protein